VGLLDPHADDDGPKDDPSDDIVGGAASVRLIHDDVSEINGETEDEENRRQQMRLFYDCFRVMATPFIEMIKRRSYNCIFAFFTFDKHSKYNKKIG